MKIVQTLVANLINLKKIFCWGHAISDLSPLAGLTKLEEIFFCGGNISDLTPLVGLTGLKLLYIDDEEMSDISPIAELTGLTHLSLTSNGLSDISALAGLTNLKWIHLAHNDISDISPLAGLTGLTRIRLERNNISDISALAGLTNLTWLNVAQNNISDFSPLDELSPDLKLIWYDNPAHPKGGPKIEGPWLWVVLLNTTENGKLGDTDLLAEVSGGVVTEELISTHGTVEGNAVGDSVWSYDRLPPTGHNNIEDMLGEVTPEAAIYGVVALYSPREQDTTMFIGGDRGARVWMNGNLIYNHPEKRGGSDYTDFSSVTLKQGLNVLLVAVHVRGNGFFGFEEGTEYTVANTGVGYTLSPTTIHRGETFTLDIHARNVSDLMGWQFDIVFDPNRLEAVDVTEGDFLKTGAATFFQGGSIDNSSGQITGLTAARLSTQSVSGTGTLLKVQFKAKASGESEVTLRNLQFVSLGGDTIDAIAHGVRITVKGGLAMGDVNRDGVVTIVDLVLVSQKLNQTVSADEPADVNGDGVVNTIDLIIVSQAIGSTTAPAAPSTFPTFPRLTGEPTIFPPPVLASRSIGAGGLRGVTTITPAMIEAWIAQARLEDDGSLAFKEGIENLEKLLASLIPEATALLRNYPNPFNPETWMPYQLATPAEVTLTIYDMNGQLVRRLAVGHQAAGMYRNRSRAAYWDGRNQLGESVASGVYFYTLRAGDFTATRRMLILK